MKAIVCSRYGSPDVLQIRDIPKPKPKGNEVLVIVYASTVNRTGCSILTEKPFLIRFFTGLFKPSCPTPGTDFAGQIEEIRNMNQQCFNRHISDRDYLISELAAWESKRVLSQKIEELSSSGNINLKFKTNGLTC